LERAKIRSIDGRVKEYEVNDKVMCRNYSDHSSSKWIPGVILQKLSPVTYLIKCGGDLVWKRHINQIIDRLDKPEFAVFETVNDTIVTPDPDADNSKLMENNGDKNMTEKKLGIKPGMIDTQEVNIRKSNRVIKQPMRLNL